MISCKDRPQSQYDQSYYEERLDDDESALPIQDTHSEALSFYKTRGKKTHQFKDARTGLVVNTTEYPAGWNVISKPVYTFDQKIPNFLVQIQGPHGLKNFNTPFKFHFYFNNPQLNQYISYPMNKLLKPVINIQQIHGQEVMERMKKSGFSLIGPKDMPREEAYAKKNIKERGSGQEQLQILNTEWQNANGQKALATIVQVALQQSISQYDYVLVWFYGVSYTFVDQNYFEDTLDKLYEAAIATEQNPQWDQYVAQLSRQRAQQAALDHQARMQTRQAVFNAHQQKMKGIWAAQDANHASFMNRNFGAGSNVGQQQFVNMINEQETVYNPLTGKNYQVNAGSTEYWMDSEGNYIENNNLFYTPNGDINLNNREWVKVKNAY